MSERDEGRPDLSAIPALIEEIDRLLAADDRNVNEGDETFASTDDVGMSAEDAAYADAKLLRLLGLSPEAAPTEPASSNADVSNDDLEWEHFVLIATATFEPAETTRDGEASSDHRDIRLTDSAIVAAIVGDSATPSRRLPVLRLTRSDSRVTASIVNVAHSASSIRLRITLDDVTIYLTPGDGGLVGSAESDITADRFATSSVNVDIARA